MEYQKIKESLKNCPDTFVGALLTVLLERAASIPVFKPGRLVKLAERIEEKHRPSLIDDAPGAEVECNYGCGTIGTLGFGVNPQCPIHNPQTKNPLKQS